MDFELEKLLEKKGITALTLQQLREITNDFSQDRVIGRGGFATIYKGVHKDGQVVAVKLFHQNPYLKDVKGFGFKNDLVNLTRLQHHQNIIKPVSYCNEQERVFVEYNGKTVTAYDWRQAICFPFVPKGSLSHHISDESHGFDWPTRYRIIKGTCQGLKHLHHGLTPAHILHMDINPSNILLDDNMVPKLAGFTLSKFFHNGEDDRETESLYGTMGYISPEYIDQRLLSKKGDIYSLGVVMIEIITGSKQHHRSLEIIDEVRANWRYKLQSTFRSSTLDAYCEQVKRCIEIALLCLEEDRHKRPDTVDITLRLSETETHKGFVYIQRWKMTYKEMEIITNNFEKQIGKGAFGTVFKGKLANGEPVAVKKLNSCDPSGKQDQIEKQIKSEEHLKHIEHENIVRLLGFCHETRQVTLPDNTNPGIYIRAHVTESLLCYELLKGSLEDKIWKDKSCIDWQTCYSVIHGICKGLHYLHKECHNAPIVHRDLKPGNVLVDDVMVPKLGDFGLSRIIPKTQTHHITSAVGSSGYMAPETVYNVKSSEITPKSDIYSLGVLILEIVTGKKCPDNEPSGLQYIDKVRQEQNSYVASRYPSLEDCFLQQVKNWISIGLHCADKLPERRPSIEHIMHFLETESANSVDMREGKVTKMSFKELQDVITNKFSAKYGESIFGAVYKGRRVNGDDVIVIKLKDQMRLPAAQFESEVKCMSFKHNNVLQLKGYGEEIHAVEVRQRLLCYEYFEGRLGEKIYGDESPTQLDWETRYKVITGICQALKYLHEECEDGPQVHMGIAPRNIWLDNDMIPKLGACGLSRLFPKDQTQIYNKETVESSLGYVAPEYVELTKMTTKSDIYSLGVLILEIVTGQKCPSSENGSAAPFIANVHKTWMKDFHVATSRYPSLDAEGLQQVKGCIKIGVRCAETSPDKRPTAGEIIPMLEKECTSKPLGFWNALCSSVCAIA